MVRRLQVLLDEAELREVQRAARSRRMTVAEWVRQALRAERHRQPVGDASRKSVARGYPRLSTRDALHVAVMTAEGVERILSFDAGFDTVAGIQRLSA